MLGQKRLQSLTCVALAPSPNAGETPDSFMLTGRLTLSDVNPVATGSRHSIYRHPTDRNLLIKVRRATAKPVWYKFHRRLYGPSIGFAREIREQLLIWSRCKCHPAFLSKIVGFCETDIGIGMVIERLNDADGNLAKNLATIIRSGDFDNEKKSDLDTFLSQLLSSPLYFDDLCAANIVYGFDKDAGRYRFVLVDGFGHKTLIPVARLLPALDRRRQKHQIDRLYSDICRLGGCIG